MCSKRSWFASLQPGYVWRKISGVRQEVAVEARGQEAIGVAFDGGQGARPGVEDRGGRLGVGFVFGDEPSDGVEERPRRVVAELGIAFARSTAIARHDGKRGRLVAGGRAGLAAKAVAPGEVRLGTRIDHRAHALQIGPHEQQPRMHEGSGVAAGGTTRGGTADSTRGPAAPRPRPLTRAMPPTPPAAPPSCPALAWPASGLPPAGGATGNAVTRCGEQAHHDHEVPHVPRIPPVPAPGCRRMEITPRSGGNSWNMK